MTKERIDKLRTMAQRGTPGEAANAKSVLAKFGVDWKQPKESFADRVKQTFGADIRKKWKIEIKYPSDLFFLSQLKDAIVKNPQNVIVGGTSVTIYCTEAEIKQINGIYNNKRVDFANRMTSLTNDWVKQCLS